MQQIIEVLRCLVKQAASMITFAFLRARRAPHGGGRGRGVGGRQLPLLLHVLHYLLHLTGRLVSDRYCTTLLRII